MGAIGARFRGWYNFVWIAASFHFALVYTLTTHPMLDMPAFETGNERLPFQFRALTAWIMAFAHRFLHFPDALQRRLPPAMSTPESFAQLGIAVVSLLAAVYATRKALEVLTGAPDASRWFSLLVIFMAYFHYLLEFGHPCCTALQLPYDLPSMAFFAIGLLFIFERRIVPLYLLVFVAMLNRESIVFLIGIYFLYELGLRRLLHQRFTSALIHAFLLFVMCLLIQRGFHFIYPHARPVYNSHGIFENHIMDNVGFIFRPYYWASYLSMFGFTWIYLYRNWRHVPSQAIRYAMAIGPLMLAAMSVVGVLSEIRIFGELISLFTVAFALLIRSQFGWADTDQPQYLARISPAAPRSV
jgi:hypothetical protein